MYLERFDVFFVDTNSFSFFSDYIKDRVCRETQSYLEEREGEVERGGGEGRGREEGREGDFLLKVLP